VARLIHLGSQLFPVNEIQAVSDVEEEWCGTDFFFYVLTVFLKGDRVVTWKSDRCNRTTPSYNARLKRQAICLRTSIIEAAWPDSQIIDCTPTKEGVYV